MSDATKHKEFALETKTHAADGAGIGGAVGGTVGAVLATLMALGTIVTVPPLGALVVAGPTIAALAGAGAGATTGGIIGALVGAAFQSIALRSTMRACARGAFSWVSKLSQATTLTSSKHCSRIWAPYTFAKNRITNGTAGLIL
jgi:hypothetical protein